MHPSNEASESSGGHADGRVVRRTGWLAGKRTGERARRAFVNSNVNFLDSVSASHVSGLRICQVMQSLSDIGGESQRMNHRQQQGYMRRCAGSLKQKRLEKIAVRMVLIPSMGALYAGSPLIRKLLTSVLECLKAEKRFAPLKYRFMHFSLSLALSRCRNVPIEEACYGMIRELELFIV